MDYNAIVQLISTLGFPIVCCCYLFYKDNKVEERHNEMYEKFTEAINNNTLALTELKNEIERKE